MLWYVDLLILVLKEGFLYRSGIFLEQKNLKNYQLNLHCTKGEYIIR
jgi:hypothetical protein